MDEDARIRRLAALALMAAGEGGDAALRAALDDPDDQVRRLAYRAAIGAAADPLPVVQRGLGDGGWLVRLEAMAAGMRLTPAMPCALVAPRLDDESAHVALAAIDAAAASCGGDTPTIERVRIWSAPQPVRKGHGDALPADRTAADGGWHRRARALVALAALEPAVARERLGAWAGDLVWQVRVAAARAAAALGEASTLDRLAADPVDNVREAALGPLVEARGAEAWPAVRAALGRDDPQLVLTAARVLEPLPASDEVVRALAEALDRSTALERETSRDIRLALLDRLRQRAGPDEAPRLRRYLEDFDPEVAARAADILSEWTGERHEPRPRALPRDPLPTASDLRRMVSVRVALHMASGARVEIRLLPDEAPLNAFRFLRLAESTYFDGLTFHRVVPGFVVQGGSPGANEYWGAGPFSRDEVGVSNLRGTIGLSTRGRDTGDAQIYVNLVDNVRLDHAYTVFAEVVQGMEAVDAFLEGERIERVEVVDPEGAAGP